MVNVHIHNCLPQQFHSSQACITSQLGEYPGEKLCAVFAEVIQQLLHLSLGNLLSEDERQEMVDLVRIVGENQIGTLTVLVLHVYT